MIGTLVYAMYYKPHRQNLEIKRRSVKSREKDNKLMRNLCRVKSKVRTRTEKEIIENSVKKRECVISLGVH